MGDVIVNIHVSENEPIPTYSSTMLIATQYICRAPNVVLSSIIRSIERAPEMFCIAVLLIYFYFSSLNLVSRMHILTCPEFTEYKLSHFFLSPAINDWINKRVEVNKCANRQLNRVPT